MLLKKGVHGNDHHIVHRNDGKGCEAQLQHPAHDAKIVIAEGNFDGSLLAKEEAKYKSHAGALADDRCQCRTTDTHIQHKNHHRVQNDVQHRAQHHRRHTGLGMTLTDDELIHTRGK